MLVPLDFTWLTISSLGIVYGDLGTSPLYTWPTILGNLETYEEDDLVGAMCLLLYSLLAIVTIKYATFIMMADNKGEGGIFALTSLVPPTRKHIKAWKRGGDPPPRYMVWTKRACMCLCIVGAGFIMGDGAITPAVSVLSAIEGTTAHTGRTHTGLMARRCRLGGGQRQGGGLRGDHGHHRPWAALHQPALRVLQDRLPLRPDHARLVFFHRRYPALTDHTLCCPLTRNRTSLV